MNKLINPHEGRELELTILGVKPFCFIDMHKQPKQYQCALTLVHAHSVVHRGLGVVTVARTGNEHLQDEYTEIIERKYLDVNVKHRLLGQLFGYPKECIDAFIKANVKCNCVNC